MPNSTDYASLWRYDLLILTFKHNEYAIINKIQHKKLLTESSAYLGFVFVEWHIEPESRRRGSETTGWQRCQSRCLALLLDVCQSGGGLHVGGAGSRCHWRRNRRRRTRKWRRRLWWCPRCHAAWRRLLGCLLLLATGSHTTQTFLSHKQGNRRTIE